MMPTETVNSKRSGVKSPSKVINTPNSMKKLASDKFTVTPNANDNSMDSENPTFTTHIVNKKNTPFSIYSRTGTLNKTISYGYDKGSTQDIYNQSARLDDQSFEKSELYNVDQSLDSSRKDSVKETSFAVLVKQSFELEENPGSQNQLPLIKMQTDLPNFIDESKHEQKEVNSFRSK